MRHEIRRVEKEREHYRTVCNDLKEKLYGGVVGQNGMHTTPPGPVTDAMTSVPVSNPNMGGPPHQPPLNTPHLGDHLVDLRLPQNANNADDYNKRVAYATSLAAATDNKLNLATLR